MNTIRNRLIHIHHCRGIGWKTILKLIEHDSSLQKVYSMTVTSLSKHFFLKKNHAEVFHHDLHAVTIEKILDDYRKKNIKILTQFDSDYPELLHEIYDPPWVLYYKGNHSFLKSPRLISVIGTRSPSNHAKPSLNQLIIPLIKKDWIVVSGLAYGVDEMAHQIAIQNGGKTIAVLGSGFDHIYPKSHVPLARIIASNHLLISEYPPHREAQKWHFPLRNRIISGLTKGTIVIEAKEKSGSLITADQALQQGREVFAVPGPIYEAQSIGTNKLIQQGAKLVVQSDDVLTELNEQF